MLKGRDIELQHISYIRFAFVATACQLWPKPSLAMQFKFWAYTVIYMKQHYIKTSKYTRSSKIGFH